MYVVRTGAPRVFTVRRKPWEPAVAAEDVSLWIGRDSLRSLATASWSGSIVTGAAVARERMVDVNTACGTDRAARRTRMRRIPLRRSLDGFAEFSE